MSVSVVPSQLRRWAFYIATAGLMCIALAVGWALGLQIVGNVHVVEDGLVYRAAQLDRGRLTTLIKTYGIRSVINLRGENRGSDWYDNEVEVTTLRGVKHFDVRMSALR